MRRTFKNGAMHLRYPDLCGNMAQIGYFTPDTARVSAEIIDSTGRWSDTNVNGSADKITGKYAQVLLNHGASPVNDTYEYVILPNATEEQVNSFATSQAGASPVYEVLRIEEDLHTVISHKFSTMFTVNFAEGTILIEEYDGGSRTQSNLNRN
jgi:hypothetical protein